MKKFICAIMTAVLLLSMTACSGGSAAGDKTVSGTLPEILTKLYDTVDVDDETRDFLKNRLQTTEVTKENLGFYFGVSDANFTEAVASEPMMSSIAFSICLMRVEDGTDIESLKTEIKEKVDPRKWICVEVDAADVRVENIGNLVILIMAENSEKYSEAFNALAE